MTTAQSANKSAISAAPGLWAGASVLPITPDLSRESVWLAGFDNHRAARGVHDDLWVRALALSDGRTRWALAVCDLIGLSRADILPISDLLHRRGALPEALTVCCTHTHSGPDTLGLWGANYFFSGRNPSYIQHVRAQVAAAVQSAIGALQPTRLRATVGQAQHWLRNSRNPDILDTAMPCLVAENLQGKPIATLVDIACHPEVLWNDNHEITSDYPHYLRAKLEADGFGIVILASADLGGMMTPKVEGHTFAQAQQMGEDLAIQAEAALSAAPLIEVAPLHHLQRPLILPLDNPIFKLARLLCLLNPSVARGVRPLSVETVVSLTQLGPLAFLACPGEVLPKLGMELRAMLPGSVPFLLGLADDELGYILPEGDFVRPANYFKPGKSYEESMSVGPQAGARLKAAVAELVST